MKDFAEASRKRACKSRSTQRFGADAKSHGNLVDDHLRPTQVIDIVEHVGAFEFAPLQLANVKTPYHRHGLHNARCVLRRVHM